MEQKMEAVAPTLGSSIWKEVGAHEYYLERWVAFPCNAWAPS